MTLLPRAAGEPAGGRANGLVHAPIVVVEDDRSVREMLCAVLAAEGHAVLSFADGEAALRTSSVAGAALVILDVGLPGISGVEVCRRIRRDDLAVPVLMLTARHDTSDRVEGLDAGADDYLVKPFALEELLARVRALIRRTRTPAAPGRERSARLDDLTIDLDLRVARRGPHQLELTKLEFDLLWLLVSNSPVVMRRDVIHHHVWGHDQDFISNSLEVFVSQLRRKTEVGGATRLVHTVRGVGYVARVDEPA
jgi:two-component system response regulator MprA